VETEGFDTQTAAKVVISVVVTLPLYGTSSFICKGKRVVTYPSWFES